MTQRHPHPITVPYMVLTVLFCVCLITANLVEIKTVSMGPLTVTAGLTIFPISYIINDCLTEVYGFRLTRVTIWLGFATNLLFILFLQLAIILPGDTNWAMQEAFEGIFGYAPRILVASFTAFLCGSFANAWVMSRMKLKSNGRNFSLRAIVSTLWGEGADTVVFFPLAFGGILPWSTIGGLIIAQVILKTLYELCVLPVTIIVVKKLKRMERMDTIDTDLRFSLW